MSFLDNLSLAKVDMAIATSAPRSNVDFMFNHMDIQSYFKAVLDESHVTRGKPDPEVYLKTANILGHSPECCVVFEDSLSGVEAALGAGCKVIAVTTTHSKEEFENVAFTVDDFTDSRLLKIENLFI